MRNALGSVQSLLVLGGTSDIALATARRLVGDRTRTVVLAGRRAEALEEAAGPLRSLGAEVAVEPWDALEDQGPAIRRIFERHGDLDLVLLAAGVLGDEERAQRDAAVAAGVLTTNFVGPAASLIACGEELRRQGHGAIAVLSSVAAQRGRRSNFVYGASKAGLDAFASGLADSLVRDGVHVMVVRPGFVRTKMTEGLDPAPLATDAESVAEAIVSGLRRGAHTVWAPAPIRAVMAVLTHLPRPVFRRLDL